MNYIIKKVKIDDTEEILTITWNGKTYVTLSRSVSFEGISFVRAIKKSDVWMDWKVVNFVTKYQYSISNNETPFNDKVKTIENAIKNKSTLKITYLKASDVQSKREVKSISVRDEMSMSKTFPELRVFYLKINDDRMFRVDSIL